MATYSYPNSNQIVFGGGGGGGGNIQTINTDSAANQTLTIGTSGTDFNIVDDGLGDHKFHLPTASATNRGALSSSNWTTFNNKIDSTEKGSPNGVASLDGAGKVPVTQLPNSIMEYQGLWNASTNTPTLADGAGNTGDVYRVSIAGTQNLGSGPIIFEVGDYVIYNTLGIWEKADTTDSVVSVNGQTGVVILTTTNIAEGTNLYFTDERAQDAVGAIVASSTKVSLTYNDGTPSIVADIVAASLTNADVSPTAAITYGKLSLTNSIVNADINASAAIVYSKLLLTNSIVAGDLTTDSVTTSKINITYGGTLSATDLDPNDALQIYDSTAAKRDVVSLADNTAFNISDMTFTTNTLIVTPGQATQAAAFGSAATFHASMPGGGSDVSSGDVLLTTGIPVRVANLATTSGKMLVTTGRILNSTTGVLSGNMKIETGPMMNALGTALALGTSGAVTVKSGDTTGISGDLNLKTGDNAGASATNSGNIVVQTGAASGTRGKIQLKNGSEGTSGHVWTSSDTVGSGSWAALPVITNRKADPTLNGTDITNQYKDLSHVARASSIQLSVYGVVQTESSDYTVSLTGGAGGNTRISFAGDLATGGAAALVNGDILNFQYETA